MIEAAKREIQKQWDGDPCGASTVTVAPGSRAFYRQVRQHRYSVYAPWLDAMLKTEAVSKKRILEIGVGLGSDHFRFAAAGNSMVALDLSREHLRQTTRHMELEGLRTRPVYGDAERTGFADESFDMVYAFGAIHHTPEPGHAVHEIRRVLKPGGVAIVALYHRYSINLLAFLVRQGVVRGGLFKRRWSTLLSEVEYRKDPQSATPLVKLFSRRQARKLFDGFEHVDISTHHVEAPRLHKKWPNTRAVFELLGSRWGWYVVVRAQK